MTVGEVMTGLWNYMIYGPPDSRESKPAELVAEKGCEQEVPQVEPQAETKPVKARKKRRTVTPELREHIIRDLTSGWYTRKELCRIHDVCSSTIQRIISNAGLYLVHRHWDGDRYVVRYVELRKYVRDLDRRTA